MFHLCKVFLLLILLNCTFASETGGKKDREKGRESSEELESIAIDGTEPERPKEKQDKKTNSTAPTPTSNANASSAPSSSKKKTSAIKETPAKKTKKVIKKKSGSNDDEETIKVFGRDSEEPIIITCKEAGTVPFLSRSLSHDMKEGQSGEIKLEGFRREVIVRAFEQHKLNLDDSAIKQEFNFVFEGPLGVAKTEELLMLVDFLGI